MQFARDQARHAHDHIVHMLQPALAAEQAERASMSGELDAYAKLFTDRARKGDDSA